MQKQKDDSIIRNLNESEMYTQGYVLELDVTQEASDTRYVLVRGMLRSKGYQDQHINKSVVDFESLTELEPEEVGGQIAEKVNGTWEKADTRLEPSLDNEDVDARVLEYEGEGTRRIEEDYTCPESERLLEEAMDSIDSFGPSRSYSDPKPVI